MESNKDVEKNIPVICNSSRLDDGNVKKPHGIHINPKFFKSANERLPQGNFGINQGPPLQPRFSHDFRMRFSGFPRPNQFDPFPQQRYPPPGPQHHAFGQPFPPYQGPRNSTSFPLFNGPPPPHLNWHNGPMMPNFQQQHHDHIRPPIAPPPFPPNYMEYNTNHPGHSSYSQFHHAHPSDYQQNVMGPMAPVPGSAYYDEGLPDFGERAQARKSRSQSSDSRRRRRSFSGSSDSYTPESRRGRSRSLSSSRSHSRNKGSDHTHGSSSSENSSEDETIWDSCTERNSDSDLDLSKPLDSLTRNVGNSKSLLKDALKCLGSSKIQTMIPLELCQLKRGELFQMCKTLLDETENDELIKVLEGSVSATKMDEMGSQNFLQSQKDQMMKSESDNSSSSLAKRKASKKKKSKKKRKKRKKRKVAEYKSENSESEKDESPKSVDEDSSSSSSSESSESEDKSETLPSNANVPKHGVCGGVSKTQQSLLELIQIEYKTKAINVMLKNLGVATEISSLVSNALNTSGGVAVPDFLQTNQEAIDTVVKEESLSADNVSSTFSEPCHSANATPSDDDDKAKATIVIKELLNSPKKLKQEQESPNKNIISGDNEMEKSSEKAPIIHSGNNKNASSIVSTQSSSLEETELLKREDEDVLDLEVGANEEIDFPDI